jgi:hypothetical protein
MLPRASRLRYHGAPPSAIGSTLCPLPPDSSDRDHRSRAHGTSCRSPVAPLRCTRARGTYRADNEGDWSTDKTSGLRHDCPDSHLDAYRLGRQRSTAGPRRTSHSARVCAPQKAPTAPSVHSGTRSLWGVRAPHSAAPQCLVPVSTCLAALCFVAVRRSRSVRSCRCTSRTPYGAAPRATNQASPAHPCLRAAQCLRCRPLLV